MGVEARSRGGARPRAQRERERSKSQRETRSPGQLTPAMHTGKVHGWKLPGNTPPMGMPLLSTSPAHSTVVHPDTRARRRRSDRNVDIGTTFTTRVVLAADTVCIQTSHSTAAQGNLPAYGNRPAAALVQLLASVGHQRDGTLRHTPDPLRIREVCADTPVCAYEKKTERYTSCMLP